MVLRDFLNCKLRSSIASGARSKDLLGVILGPVGEAFWIQIGAEMERFCMLVLTSNSDPLLGSSWAQHGPNLGLKRPQHRRLNFLKRGLKVLEPRRPQDPSKSPQNPSQEPLGAQLGPNIGSKRAGLGLKMRPQSGNMGQPTNLSINQSISPSSQQPNNPTSVRSSNPSRVAGLPKAVGYVYVYVYEYVTLFAPLRRFPSTPELTLDHPPGHILSATGLRPTPTSPLGNERLTIS